MRRVPGFTLIEVVIAITVTAIVAVAVYLAASTALASAQRSRAVQLEARTQRNARMVLTALLRSARAEVGPADARLVGVDGARTTSGSDELRLVGALGFPFARYPAGEPLRVRVWLGVPPQSPPARALLLELAPWPEREGGGEGADTLVLFARLDGVEITYRDPIRDVWLDDWDRAAPLLPAAVAIEFRSVPPIPPLVVSLPGARPRR
jgi:prepilin-type N-terminal cleavage/methylation domain-containing protein